jgi:hypothetical protein
MRDLELQRSYISSPGKCRFPEPDQIKPSGAVASSCQGQIGLGFASLGAAHVELRSGFERGLRLRSLSAQAQTAV